MAKKARRKVSRRFKAYHEAGHAVMAFLLRRKVTCVSIVPDAHGQTHGVPRSQGRTIFQSRVDNFLKRHANLCEQAESSSEMRSEVLGEAEERRLKRNWHRLIREEIQVLLAGMAATKIMQDSARSVGPGMGADEDFEKAINLARNAPADDDAALHIVVKAGELALQKFRKPMNWRAVESIAERLIKESELSGKVARQLFRDAVK